MTIDPAAPLTAADDTPEWQPGDRFRLVVLTVLLVVGVGYLLSALQLKAWNEQGPQAGFFPVLVGGLFVACFAAELLRTLLRMRREGEGGSSLGRFEPKILAVPGSILGYVLLVGVIGHLLTSMLVVVAMLVVFGRRAWWQVALTAVITAVTTDFVFTVLLGFRLPAGALGFGFASWI